jgi:hypothetical protein
MHARLKIIKGVQSEGGGAEIKKVKLGFKQQLGCIGLVDQILAT